MTDYTNKDKLKKEIELLYTTGNCTLITTKDKIAFVNDTPLILSDFGVLIHNKPIDIESPEFTPIPPSEGVLEKYVITEDEYQLISFIMQRYLMDLGTNFKPRKSFWNMEVEGFKNATI